MVFWGCCRCEETGWLIIYGGVNFFTWCFEDRSDTFKLKEYKIYFSPKPHPSVRKGLEHGKIAKECVLFETSTK